MIFIALTFEDSKSLVNAVESAGNEFASAVGAVDAEISKNSSQIEILGVKIDTKVILIGVAVIAAAGVLKKYLEEKKEKSE